jgi:hypothetical protein
MDEGICDADMTKSLCGQSWTLTMSRRVEVNLDARVSGWAGVAAVPRFGGVLPTTRDHYSTGEQPQRGVQVRSKVTAA